MTTNPTPDRPVNDMRELYAVQHAITDAGGTLAPEVHKAIDELREVWDRELRRAQAEVHQYRTALQGTARNAASAVVAVAAPPTGQTALRDRIAEVLARFGDVDQHAMAAAVLAVLPAGSEDTTTTRADALAEAIAAVEAERDATDVNVAVYPRYDQRQRNALDSGIRVLRRLAAETRQGCTLCGHLTCVGGHPCGVISTQQGDLPEPCACTGPAEPTAEETARNHVIALHQIGEQLAGIESWMWEHLADVRGAARQPAASAGVQTDEETSR